jgi:polysaccharide pyruvyl transferase WcaK-like protein
MLGKPVISLAYHQKFAPIMNDLGLSEYCQDLENLNIEMLCRQFETMNENREKIITTIEKKTKEYRQKLQEQYSFLFQ